MGKNKLQVFQSLQLQDLYQAIGYTSARTI